MRDTFERLFTTLPGRVVVAMLGSHLFRVRHALGRVPVGQRLMRRDGLAPVSPQALQERRSLAETGVVVAVVVMQLGSGRVLSGPVLHAQGLQGDEASALSLAGEGARLNLDGLSEAMRGDDERVREEVTRGVRRVFKQLLGSRPTVMPIVLRLP